MRVYSVIKHVTAGPRRLRSTIIFQIKICLDNILKVSGKLHVNDFSVV